MNCIAITVRDENGELHTATIKNKPGDVDFTEEQLAQFKERFTDEGFTVVDLALVTVQ